MTLVVEQAHRTTKPGATASTCSAISHASAERHDPVGDSVDLPDSQGVVSAELLQVSDRIDAAADRPLLQPVVGMYRSAANADHSSAAWRFRSSA
jgi:hypothetical protein